MVTKFEDLRILKAAEKIADGIWKEIVQWNDFSRDVVGKQITRAADSIGANIAESYGCFHYGEKLQFLYYARGSLFETKYWLNRSASRQLLPVAQIQYYADSLSKLAHQLNTFAASIKRQKAGKPAQIRERQETYLTNDASLNIFLNDNLLSLFTEDELLFIKTVSPIEDKQSPNLPISQLQSSQKE